MLRLTGGAIARGLPATASADMSGKSKKRMLTNGTAARASLDDIEDVPAFRKDQAAQVKCNVNRKCSGE